MRILQVSSARTYGGGEKHLIDLCRGLNDKGHQIFAALREENEFEERLSFLPADQRLHVSLRNSLDLFSAHKIGSFLRAKEIDIVHSHLARDYPPTSMAVRLYPKTRLVLTRHVLFPLKNPHKLVLKNVSRAIAVSSAVEEVLAKTFPLDKIRCIPNGIDVEKWASVDRASLSKEFRLRYKIPAGVELIGTVGELKEIKGQQDFVIASEAIQKEHPKTHFLIVGKDNSLDQSYRLKLKRLVKVLDLEDNFTFLDWVDETAPLLSAMDVFVSPSHSESFGLAILEAMASGAAIVATETDGALGLIQDGKTGKLVKIKDPSIIAEHVLRLLENGQSRAELALNAQNYAVKNFGLQRMIDRTEDVYQEVLQ